MTALDENAQAVVANYLEQTRCKIKGTGADEIVKAFNTNSLNFGSLDDIFESEDKKHKPITSIKITKFLKYFSGVRDSEYIEQTIEKASEMYFEHIIVCRRVRNRRIYIPFRVSVSFKKKFDKKFKKVLTN